MFWASYPRIVSLYQLQKTKFVNIVSLIENCRHNFNFQCVSKVLLKVATQVVYVVRTVHIHGWKHIVCLETRFISEVL